MAKDACVVFVTCDSREEAERIAERVVEERLAACVNVITEGGSIKSFYHWEGALQRDSEYLMVMKTFVARLEALEKRVKELHSYTVPEFIAFPVIYGSDSYIEWMSGNVD